MVVRMFVPIAGVCEPENASQNDGTLGHQLQRRELPARNGHLQFKLLTRKFFCFGRIYASAQRVSHEQPRQEMPAAC